MTCRACNPLLPADARFCPACGTPVEPACRSREATLPDGARFCRMQLLRAAAEALRERPEAAWSALAGIGDALAEAGYRLLAAEVDADAALLAARARVEAVSLARRARERFAASSVVPPLRDPVEAVEAAGTVRG